MAQRKSGKELGPAALTDASVDVQQRRETKADEENTAHKLDDSIADLGTRKKQIRFDPGHDLVDIGWTCATLVFQAFNSHGQPPTNSFRETQEQLRKIK